MPKLSLYQVDAFTEVPFQGNPAAVCPLEEWLPDSVLQSIAEENNLSETAFYLRDGPHFPIRWFTPTAEVDLCGHATLAAAHVIFQRGDARGDAVSFQSRSGVLSVTRETDGWLTLDFPALVGEPCETPSMLEEALGAAPIQCFRSQDYLAVFEDESLILSLDPDFRQLRYLDLRALIVTAPGSGEIDFVSRFFAPKVGVDEDPVTGSAHCTLTPYWAGRLGKSSLLARQLSRRSGMLRCQDKGDRVLISGQTVLYLEGSIVFG